MMDKRVRAFMKTYPRNQFGEKEEEMIQVLEIKKLHKFLWWSWYSWKEIDREIVPSFAWIQKNTLGSTDWKSKWNGMPNVEWKKIKQR